MGVVVIGRTLVWNDTEGGLWTMPADGGARPRQLSNQHGPGFAFHPVVAGGQVFAAAGRDVLRVGLPDGPVAPLGVRGLPDTVEELVGDDEALYATVFQHTAVLRIPLDGGAPRRLLAMRRGVLAIHGGTLYVAGYVSGELVAVPARGGKRRTIARGLRRPTALAVDDEAAYIYSEKDRAVRRIDLATGRARLIADHLVNSDRLVCDGPWLYTFSWGAHHALVRLAKDGSRRDVLADDLRAPYAIAVDADAIYATSRDTRSIVRIPKAR
jgi:hypothetical protein